MEIHIVSDAASGARIIADLFEQTVRSAGAEGAVLGLATGSSPVPTYEELIRRHREEGLSFAGCRAFLLDEYVGLGADHEQSYRRFIRENLTDHIDIDDEQVSSPDGAAADPQAEAAAYEERLADSGGVDLQILGVGSNGHIGFNEPGSSLASRTRVVGLADSTIKDNSRYFATADEVPVRAISQGVGTILESRRIVLTASGANKADAVAHLVEGGISSRWPCSILQTHPDVVVVVDEAAASKLELADYYRHLRTLDAQQPLTSQG